MDSANLSSLQPRDQARRIPSSATHLLHFRVELIDQQALTEALRQRRIAGAGLDVFEQEPLPPDDPLTKLDNVILTPHWLASTADVWLATGRATAEGMLRAAGGQVPQNVVNAEVLGQPLFRAKLARFVAT